LKFELFKQLIRIVQTLSLIIIVTGCSNNSPRETIKNAWEESLDINEIITRQKVSDGTIILFNAQNKNQRDGFEWIGIALVEKQNDSNWKLLDTGVGTVYNNIFSAHHEILRFETEKGKIKELPIAFGKLLNSNISTVQAEVDNEMKTSDIVNTKSGRYFYDTNAWGPIEALNEQGKIIDEY